MLLILFCFCGVTTTWALLFQILSEPKPKLFDATILRVLLRGQPSPSDYTSVNSAQSWQDMQQIAYVANSPGTNTVPLYRHATTGDHRDALSSSLAGYTAEFILGHLYTSAETGMSSIRNTFNGSNNDYATSVQAIPGFSMAEEFGYGYPRYGNQLEDFTSITNSGVIIRCNNAFGGTVWHIEYDGVQFINNFEQGRQLQMSCRWREDNSSSLEYIASESGRKRDDFIDGLSAYDTYKHIGSPMVGSYVDVGSKFLATKTIPLEFMPTTSATLGGGTWNPVLYERQTCSKFIHYDYNGMGPVFRYQQIWNFPAPAEADDVCQMEASIHLNGGFDTVFRYHPDIKQLENMLGQWISGGFNDEDFGIRCFIFADSTKSHCLGIVARDMDDGGSWELATAINGSEEGSGSGEFDNPFNVLYLLNFEPYQTGDNNYYYYLIVGDLTTVTNKAQILYDTRASHLW